MFSTFSYSSSLVDDFMHWIWSLSPDWCIFQPPLQKLLFAMDGDCFRDAQLLSVQRIRDHGPLGPKRGICILSSFLRLRNHHGRGARKIVGVRSNWSLQQNSVYWTRQSCYIVNSLHTRSVQDQASKNRSVDGESLWSSAPSWEAASCWWLLREGESVFLRDVGSERLPMWQSVILHIHAFTDSTNSTQYVFVNQVCVKLREK